MLRPGVPLLGSLAEQGDRFGLIHRDAPAGAVACPEIILGVGISLVGGLAEPPSRDGEIPLHALAVQVAETQLVLDRRIRLVSGRQEGLELRRFLGRLEGFLELFRRAGIPLGS